MSSRGDHRRRERSWERENRDRDRGKDRERDTERGGDRYSRGGRGGRYRDQDHRRRHSRSRSPRRDGGRERRDYDRRDGEKERDSRRDRDEARRPDRDGWDRDHEEKRRRENDSDDRRPEKPADTPNKSQAVEPISSRNDAGAVQHSQPNQDTPNQTSRATSAVDGQAEEGEAMDAINDDDADMMAAMGMSNFGSTKGKHVAGNQEGSVDVKKIRTWRQYMNRRGGFNRPLDRIK